MEEKGFNVTQGLALLLLKPLDLPANLVLKFNYFYNRPQKRYWVLNKKPFQKFQLLKGLLNRLANYIESIYVLQQT